MAKKDKSNQLGNYALAFILGVLVCWLVINLTTKPVYTFGACTINKHHCAGIVNTTVIKEWDGICTDEITDACCEPVRTCGGTTDDPYACYDDYCWNEGEKCGAEYNVVTSGWTCKCVDVQDFN